MAGAADSQRGASEPRTRLAARDRRDASPDWLAHGERLEARDRPIRPGDVMVLVRRRERSSATWCAR